MIKYALKNGKLRNMFYKFKIFCSVIKLISNLTINLITQKNVQMLQLSRPSNVQQCSYFINFITNQ